MSSTGNVFPGTGANDAGIGATAWTNPGNITATDASDATCNAGASSQYLVAKNFGFSIPAGAGINGITVRVNASETSAGSETLNARLQDAAGALTGTGKTASINGTSKIVYTYGSTADVWGATLDSTVVNDADFGVRLWFTTAHNVAIDYVTVAVEYTSGSVALTTQLVTSTAGVMPSGASRTPLGIAATATPGTFPSQSAAPALVGSLLTATGGLLGYTSARQIQSGQGVLTPTTPLTGIAITSGRGDVTADTGPPVGEVIDGLEAAAVAQDIPGTTMFVKLHSKKPSGGSASRPIVGSALTSVAGLFTPISGKAPVGQLASLLGGTINGRGSQVPLGSLFSAVSPGTLNVSGGAATLETDWIARSTPLVSSGPGVFFATRFNTASEVTPFLDGNAGNDGRTVVWDQTIKRSGAGAARINIPDGYGGNPGAIILPWGRTIGSGQTYYVQFSIFIPQSLLRYKPHFSAGQGGASSAGEGGTKFCIISAYPPGSSASNNAVVINNHEYRGFPVTYWYDGVSGVVQGQELRSVAGGTNNNFVWENQINTGSPANPTTQSQYEQRYGPLWHNDTLPQQGLPVMDSDIYAAGFPSSSAHVSCPFWIENGWNTVTVGITFGTLGTASNRIRVWICRPGSANTLLQDWTGIQMGTDNGGHTGIWLTPYDTNRDYYGKRADTYVVYSEVIASTNFINPPAVNSNAVWTPPYTIPAAGAVQAIGTNSCSSVTPSGMSSGAWNYSTGASYSGGTLLNEYSVAGAFALTSTGGHQANENPGSGLFDFTDATWKVLPVPGIAYSDATYALGSTNGSPFFEIDGNQTPAPAHTIGMAVEIPGKGSAVAPGCAITDSSLPGLVVHYQNMRTGVWARMSNSQRLSGNVDYGFVAYDSTRNRIWLGESDFDARTQTQYFDLADNTWKLTSSYSTNFVQFDCRVGPFNMFRGWVVRTTSTGRIFAFNPDEPTNGWPECSVIGGSSMADYGEVRSLNKYAYHPPTGNFYTVPDKTGGTTLHKLIPPKARSVFIGSISGTTLTVGTLQSGTVTIGQAIYSGGIYRGRVVSGSGPYTLSQSNSVASTDMVGQPTPLSATWVASTITLPTSLPAHYSFVHDPTANARGYTATQFIPSIGVLAYFPMNTNSVYLINPEPVGTAFSTTFPLTENPISQGGVWINGQTNGLVWQNTRSNGTSAFGVAVSGGYDDCIACLSTGVGISSTSHYAQGTAKKVAGYSPGTSHEVEILTGWSISANVAKGYECTWDVGASVPQLVRWNGALGDFTLAGASNDNLGGGKGWSNTPSGSGGGQLVTGDLVKVTYAVVSGTVTLTVFKNGIQIMTCQDTSANKIVSGQPGMGFFGRTGATMSSYCWSAFSAG